MGGTVPLGFDAVDKQLVANEGEVQLVNHIYKRYLALGCVRRLKNELDVQGKVSKIRQTNSGTPEGKPFSRGALYQLLKNPIYIGRISHKSETYEGQHDAIVPQALWNDVQSMLQKNSHRKRIRAESKEISLLAGLIEDDCRNPMSPSHTKKGSRRYRYYVSQAILQFKEQQAGSVVRISATEIEKIVISHILSQLSDAHLLLKLLDTSDLAASRHAELIANGKSLTERWSSLTTTDQLQILQAIAYKVILSKEQVKIHLKTMALRSLLMLSRDNLPLDISATKQDTENITVLAVPARLQRSGIETKLVVTNAPPPPAHQQSIQAIQAALLKALKWNMALTKSSTLTMSAIAKEENVNQRYIAQLLPLACLAPDIMDAIAKGNIPATFSLRNFKKGFPRDWKAQRQRFFSIS